MGFHELGHDLVFARELGFEFLDHLDIGILDGLGLAAIFEGEVCVLECPHCAGVRIDLVLEQVLARN